MELSSDELKTLEGYKVCSCKHNGVFHSSASGICAVFDCECEKFDALRSASLNELNPVQICNELDVFRAELARLCNSLGDLRCRVLALEQSKHTHIMPIGVPAPQPFPFPSPNNPPYMQITCDSRGGAQ